MSKPRALWQKHGAFIVPANEDAKRMFDAMKQATDYLGEFHGARSLKQLRLYWGLAAMLVEHELFPSRQAASDAIKIGTGHVETLIMPKTGEVFLIPKSIAFESMKQVEFSEFMENAIRMIATRWLPGAEEELRKQFFDAIDDPARGPGRRVFE
jgi:hypothetical protein